MNKFSIRTFIYKMGDSEADSKIKGILGEGWKILSVTPNGKLCITTFSRASLDERNLA